MRTSQLKDTVPGARANWARLGALVGAAATLRARTDLPIDEHLALLDVIVKEAVVLERICLAPKIMHPSEDTLDPTPTLRERAPSADPAVSGP